MLRTFLHLDTSRSRINALVNSFRQAGFLGLPILAITCCTVLHDFPLRRPSLVSGALCDASFCVCLFWSKYHRTASNLVLSTSAGVVQWSDRQVCRSMEWKAFVRDLHALELARSWKTWCSSSRAMHLEQAIRIQSSSTSFFFYVQDVLTDFTAHVTRVAQLQRIVTWMLPHSMALLWRLRWLCATAYQNLRIVSSRAHPLLEELLATLACVQCRDYLGSLTTLAYIPLATLAQWHFHPPSGNRSWPKKQAMPSGGMILTCICTTKYELL